MAVKRIVDTRFWEDNYVLDNYSVEDKFFYLYLLTNPRTTQIGIYSLPKRVISFDTGYTVEVINVLLDRFCNNYQNIIYSPETQEISLLNSLKYSIIKGGKPVSDLLVKELSQIRDASLIYSTYERMCDFWTISDRLFDKTVKQLFEHEVSKRNRLVEPNLTLRSESDESNYKAVTRDHLSLSYYEANYGILSDEMKVEYTKWIEKLSDELVVNALQRSGGSNNPYKYSLKILQNWFAKGMKSLADIDYQDLKFSQKKSLSRNYDKSVSSEEFVNKHTEALLKIAAESHNK